MSMSQRLLKIAKKLASLGYTTVFVMVLFAASSATANTSSFQNGLTFYATVSDPALTGTEVYEAFKKELWTQSLRSYKHVSSYIADWAPNRKTDAKNDFAIIQLWLSPNDSNGIQEIEAYVKAHQGKIILNTPIEFQAIEKHMAKRQLYIAKLTPQKEVVYNSSQWAFFDNFADEEDLFNRIEKLLNQKQFSGELKALLSQLYTTNEVDTLMNYLINSYTEPVKIYLGETVSFVTNVGDRNVAQPSIWIFEARY